VVNVDMLEGVSGVLALLSPIEHQSDQIFVTAYDLTSVHTAHTLHTKGESRQLEMPRNKKQI